jgi:hypothetical protein
MDPRRIACGAALALCLSNPASAQPKKGTPAAHSKGRAPGKGAKPGQGTTEATTAPPAASGDNPYGGGEAPEPLPAAAASGTAETSSASGSSDAKLDEAPPPRSDKATGPGISPLTPEANELPPSAPKASPEILDKLMADIATLRGRVAALTTSLFSSKLRVAVRTGGDDARIQGFVVTLDEGVVFRAQAGFIAEDDKIVYEHAAAPGNHVVGIEVERQDTRGASFKTWQVSRFAIQIPERKTLEASVRVEDDSDMADDFPDDHDGEYELGVRLRAKVVE